MIRRSNFQEKPFIDPDRMSNPVFVKTNLTKLRINNTIKIVYLYSIKFDSIIPLDNAYIKRIILRNLKQSIKEKFKIHLVAGDNLFSPMKIDDEIKLISKVIVEEEEKMYQVEFNLVKDYKLDLQQTITNDDQFYQQKKIFVEILIKNILHANKLLRVNRIYFDKNKFKELNHNGFCKSII